MLVEQNTQLVTSRDAWFEEFIAAITTHKLLLDTDTASKEIRETYDMLMRGDSDEMMLSNRLHAHKYFIKKIILDYITALYKEKIPVRLAFDMDSNEILVWAEINDGDVVTEDKLLLTEAKINAIYHEVGYDITTTIVEKNDCQGIPSHYAEFNR